MLLSATKYGSKAFYHGIFDWSSEDTIQNDTKEKWEKGGYAGFQRNSIEEKCLLAKQNEEIHAVKETDIWDEETRYK